MSELLRASEADRAALAEVLARPEFRDREPDTSALRRLVDELWSRLLEALGTAEAERYAAMGRAVFLAAVALAALLLWRAVRRRRRGAAAPSRAPGQAAAARSFGPPDVEAAAAALAHGDLVAAVRQAYAAAAAALGALAPAGQALTGPELAARAGDEGFGGLARLHDRTVFGRLPVAEPEARQAVEVARRLAPGRRAP